MLNARCLPAPSLLAALVLAPIAALSRPALAAGPKPPGNAGKTAPAPPAKAPTAPPDQTNFEFHNRDTGAPLPLLSMKSRTRITGPVAVTDVEFVAENKNPKAIEAAVTFEVPKGTVLTKFGYYYGARFIPGVMYDKDEAWKIYSAVTSRGRDPGIMDRPSATNYHAQIFPVAPKRDLRVHITLVQMLQTTRTGLRFELPLVQGTPYLGSWNNKPFAINAQIESAKKIRFATLRKTYAPNENLALTVPFETSGVVKSAYSGMVGAQEGYYAVTIVAPRRLRNVRARFASDGLTSLSLPTRFGDVDPYGDIHIVGRYRKPGPLRITLRGASGERIVVPITLSANRVKNVRDNPAAALWADKRIAVLQTATRRNFKNDIIALSRRFMVVSDFTALLAIPKEELEYYRKVLAARKIETNTNTIGGGGGDPYIAVRAPQDASQVVALFPDGDIKNLLWNEDKAVWEARFDFPFGTPEGPYRVTIIVVQKNGLRNEFTLVYQNRLTGPVATDTAERPLVAAVRGQATPVSVQGANIQRATALAPWGERVALTDAGQGKWIGEVHVPDDFATGATSVTLILLDGAHNSTEVTVELDVR